MVKPTEKRVYFTRHAQSELEYVLVLIRSFSPSLTNCFLVYSVTCNSNSEYPSNIAGGSRTYKTIYAIVHDPQLTQNGRHQSTHLNDDTNHTFQKTAELLVTSPLKRSLQTMIIGYPVLGKRLEGEGTPVVVLPQLQGVTRILRSKPST
jgi:broad specificity phosphatase PhoE